MDLQSETFSGHSLVIVSTWLTTTLPRIPTNQVTRVGPLVGVGGWCGVAQGPVRPGCTVDTVGTCPALCPFNLVTKWPVADPISSPITGDAGWVNLVLELSDQNLDPPYRMATYHIVLSPPATLTVISNLAVVQQHSKEIFKGVFCKDKDRSSSYFFCFVVSWWSAGPLKLFMGKKWKTFAFLIKNSFHN